MASVTTNTSRSSDREALRRELLERIVRSEALRRNQRKARQQ